jgi:lipoyl(octanoyl) transferase
MATPLRHCIVYNAVSGGSLTSYEKAWRYQKLLVEHVYQCRKANNNHPDSMLLVQHPSIYTLGRGASMENLKFKPTKDSLHKVVRVERGGEVTWHGPGMIVAYPIFDLHNHKKDLHWYATSLEQTVINTLEKYNVVGERSEVNTGVWVGKNKISAIGVTASRWVTMHGIALNVNCDLANFGRIIPCGIVISDRGVCSLEQQQMILRNTPPTKQRGDLDDGSDRSGDSHLYDLSTTSPIDDVCNNWIDSFSKVFSFDKVTIYNSTHTVSRGTNSKTGGNVTTEVKAGSDKGTPNFPTIAELSRLYPTTAASLALQHITLDDP